MKTKSFLLGAAALMLAASCSNDEVVEVAQNNRAIGFSSFVNKSTRAEDLGGNNLESASVYGVSYGPDGGAASVIFNDTEIKKGGGVFGDGSVWAYDADQTQYWIPNFSYTFAAVAPHNANGVTVNNSAATKINGGISSIVFENNGQVDLLFDAQDVPYSTAEGAAWGQTVPFDLKHILSRVMFNFTNSVNNDYKVEVSGIKLTNAYAEGTFTPDAETKWDVTGERGSFAFTDETVSAEYNGTARTQPTYLIPVNQDENDGFVVEFTVALYIKDASTGKYNDNANATYTLTANLPALDYKLGYSYAFTTELTWANIIGGDKDDSKIEFTVKSVADWNDKHSDADKTLTSEKKENAAEGE